MINTRVNVLFADIFMGGDTNGRALPDYALETRSGLRFKLQ